jgi:hypothetical protein
MKICPNCGRENPADYTWCPECGAKPKIEPTFPLEMSGFEFLGRGPKAAGASSWRTVSDIYYRCITCGDLMRADHRGYFSCSCKAMHLDWDAGRFGSSYGDENILVYRKTVA